MIAAKGVEAETDDGTAAAGTGGGADKSGRRHMLSEKQVLEIIPVGRTTLYRVEKKGRFPKSTYISPNRRVWFESDIIACRTRLTSSTRTVAGARGVVAVFQLVPPSTFHELGPIGACLIRGGPSSCRHISLKPLVSSEFLFCFWRAKKCWTTGPHDLTVRKKRRARRSALPASIAARLAFVTTRTPLVPRQHGWDKITIS